MKTASWVIVNLETGKPLFETFEERTAKSINKEKYKAVPIHEWLVSLNKKDVDVPTDKYTHFNHHHELTDDHENVDFGNGEFIANKDGIPLLKALNEIGLRTRTHHIKKDGHSFVSILLDQGVHFEIRKVFEKDAGRADYNGLTELLICWENKK